MKNLLVLFLALISFNAFGIQVDVITAEYPVKDYDGRNTLCLTIVRVPKSGALLGIVESIEDCYYARRAKKSPAHKINISLRKLEKIVHPEMREHLQRIDTQLEFYYSDGD